MTQEEKVRAYDEALEKAKSMIDDLRKGEDILAVSNLESMFPELKESEDERVRKTLIRFHKSTIDVDGIKGEDIIDWLTNVEVVDAEKKELKKLGQSEVTKMSDQEEIAEIPFGAKDSELQEATYYIPKGFHAEIDDDKVVIKKGEKPTAWSEEDEEYLRRAINATKDTYPMTAKWLKSLKQRIGG